MIRFLSVLAVVMSAAGWVALLAGARSVMICLIAWTGPVIALWTPFFMAKLRRLGNPPLMDPLEPRTIIRGRRASLIRALGITGAVLGPALGFYGFWFWKVPRLMPVTILLFLVLLTLISCYILLLSVSVTARPITPQLSDEMMEQLKGKAAVSAFQFMSILFIPCVVLAGVWNCSREVMATVLMALWLASQLVFKISYYRERRKMVA